MIAIVPARGGSKGLPGKNLRLLDGAPLIHHTLRAALSAQLIDRVIVSTDCPEIASACLRVDGVEVPFMRPAGLATDEASAIDAYLHAAAWLAEHEGQAPRSLCVLLPTSPMRLPGDIDAAITLFKTKEAKVVLSVVETKPAAWLQLKHQDGRLTPLLGRHASVANRQDLPGTWVPNGSVYVLDMDELQYTRTYFGDLTFGLVMPPERSVDIDSEVDFALAEILCSRNADEQDRRLYSVL